MKRTKNLLWLLAATLFVFGTASCSDDNEGTPDPDPEPPTPVESIYPTTPNTFVVNGEETSVGTTFVNNYDG